MGASLVGRKAIAQPRVPRSTRVKESKMNKSGYGGTYHGAKVPHISTIGPADAKENFWSAEFVGLYGVDERLSPVPTLGKAKVGNLRYHFPEAFQHRPEVVVTAVHCTAANVLAGHRMSSLPLDEGIDGRLVLKSNHDIIEL